MENELENEGLAEVLVELAKENERLRILAYLRKALERGETLEAVIGQLEAMQTAFKEQG